MGREGSHEGDARSLRRAAKRDSVEVEVVGALRSAGVDVYLTSQPFDAILGYRGKTFLAEFKSGKRGRFTEAQQKFMSYWRGAPVVVLRSVEDAIAWVNSLSLETSTS